MYGYGPDLCPRDVLKRTSADRDPAVYRHVTGPYVTVAGIEPATRNASIV